MSQSKPYCLLSRNINVVVYTNYIIMSFDILSFVEIKQKKASFKHVFRENGLC